MFIPLLYNPCFKSLLIIVYLERRNEIESMLNKMDKLNIKFLWLPKCRFGKFLSPVPVRR